jgi:hypothetical protein
MQIRNTAIWRWPTLTVPTEVPDKNTSTRQELGQNEEVWWPLVKIGFVVNIFPDLTFNIADTYVGTIHRKNFSLTPTENILYCLDWPDFFLSCTTSNFPCVGG